MTNYFITGLTGFLGTNLLKELEKLNDIQIFTLVLPNELNSPCLKYSFVKPIEGSITNKKDVENFLSQDVDGIKIVIHAAGRITTVKKHDELSMKVNFEGTKNIVDSMNKIGGFERLIYISSVDSMPIVKTNDEIYEVGYYDVDKVNGIYGKSKALANNYILDNLKTKSVLLLPSAIMGPNDPKLTPINKALNKFINGKLPAISKGGYNIVDVRDVSKGIVNASFNGKDKESYFLSGQYISVEDLIKTAAKVSNKKPVTRKVPHFLIKTASPFIELDAKIHKKTPLFTGFSMDCLMQNSNYSYKKAHNDFGYEPRPLEESIKDTISWMNDVKNQTK